MIFLRALGTAEIDTGTVTLTPSQEIVFAAALYLIVERGKPISRNLIASLLWPHVPEKARAHRLRQTILQLKKLGIRVRADRDTLQIAHANMQSDVEELLSAERASTFENGPIEFLPGYNARFSEQYRDWVDAKREETRAILTRRLVTSIRVARANGDWENCERLAVRCRGLDQFNESAILAHAEASAMRGSKVEALAMLDAYVSEVGPTADISLPATLLRRRITERLPERKPNHSIEPGLVGRANEMKVLIERLERARKGEGGAYLLEGDAGVGKTRLSDELMRFAELQNVAVLRVRCKRAESDQPLAAFVDMIPVLREMPGALGCSQQTLTWLKRLIDVDVTLTEPQVPLEDSAVVFGYVRRAILDLLDAISDERCLLMVIEDVQWLDAASAGLLAGLVEVLVTKKLMILFNSRGISNPLLNSYKGPSLQVIHLSPLNQKSARVLLNGLVGPDSGALQADDFDWLIEAADGNPFFLQELAKHRLETGQRHEMPPLVATVLDERLARLSPLACQVLQASAVLGENSNSGRVSRVLECAAHDLLTAIDDLTFAGMLRSSGRETTGSTQLLPRHDLLSTAVLKRLPPLSTSFLHQRCAVVLGQELSGPSISTSILRACAFHWNRSGDSERAFSAAIKCADHLLEIGLAADAAAAFEAATSYCRTVEAQLDTLRRTIQALRQAREWTRLLETIGKARALSAGPVTVHDDLELIEFDALRRMIKPIAEVFSRTLVCVYDSSLSPGHRVAAAEQALKLATARADFCEMPRIYDAVRGLLHSDDVDWRARAAVELVYNTMCGDLDKARAQARENVAFERAHGSPTLLLFALGDLSFVLRRTGPIEEIMTTLCEAYAIAVRHKLPLAAQDMAARIAGFCLDRDQSEAAEWLERGIAINTTNPDPQILSTLSDYKARMAVDENRLSDAQSLMAGKADLEWLKDRRGWHAASVAIIVRLMISQRAGAAQLAPYVETLESLYEFTATVGGQDYEVASLYFGLRYLDKDSEAESYAIEYIENRRRDKLPLPVEWNSIRAGLGKGRRRQCNHRDMAPVSGATV